MFAERDRKQVPKIATDVKRVHPQVHSRISSTHARTPRVLKYLKRAGQGNIRVSLKNIVSKFRNIVQERHEKYKYSSLEAELSRFFSLSKRFFPYNESFSLIRQWSKNCNVQPALDS